MSDFSALNTGYPQTSDRILDDIALIAARLDNLESALLGSKSLTAIDINGGAIDGTAIGAGTPADGAFTTLSASGDVSYATLNSNYMSFVNTFGDGSDGAYTSSGNFNLTGIKNYTNFTLQSPHVMTINGNSLIMFVNGTLTIAGNITGAGYGGAGGAVRENPTASGPGYVGTNSYGLGGAGGAGGSITGYVGGSGGSVYTPVSLLSGGTSPTTTGAGTAGSASAINKYAKQIMLTGYGAGGGGGGYAGAGEHGKEGGAGGAGLLIIARRLVITGTPTITCAGINGVDSPGGHSASCGGGGGGGGSILLYYKTLVSGSIPTLTVTGGAGGDGSNSGANGGNGGAGYSAAIQLV